MPSTDTILSLPTQYVSGLQSAGQAADTPVMDTFEDWLAPDPGFMRVYCGAHIPEEHEVTHIQECAECLLEEQRLEAWTGHV